MTVSKVMRKLRDNDEYREVVKCIKYLIDTPHAQLYAAATALRLAGREQRARIIEDIIEWQKVLAPERTVDHTQLVIAPRRLPRERL